MDLECMGSRALNFEMGVPPVPELGVFAQVLVADIKPANKPDDPIDDRDLPVVPEVHPEVDEGDP